MLHSRRKFSGYEYYFLDDFSDICQKSNAIEPIQNFAQLTTHLKQQNRRKRIAVVCANDPNTEYATTRVLEEGIAEFPMIEDSIILEKYPTLKQYPDYVKTIHIGDSDEAIRRAVHIVREGGADILMKGIINTDGLPYAIPDKEKGLLPKGKIPMHLAVMGIPTYHKLLFFPDAVVIPRSTLQQRIEVIWHTICTCRYFGTEQPCVAPIYCTEKVSARFPHSLNYVNIAELAKAGELGNVTVDGPLDIRTACKQASGDIKGIASPINGQANVLILPSIESGSTLYRFVSLSVNADTAGLLQGPICPVVLPSRSDSSLSKYYSITMACLQVVGCKCGEKLNLNR